MSYAVALGQTGIGGWRMLTRTAATQQAVIARDAALARAHEHVREALPKATSAEGLVSDYSLLRTTLEAFGLEGDLRNKAFIRRVIDSDLDDPKSLANRLTDKRYLAMAKTLKLSLGSAGSGNPATDPASNAAETIITRHISAIFEARVGDQDSNLRMALYARRELADLAVSPSTDATKWYTIIGSKQLRAVVGGAFGFPSGFEKLPVDRQLAEFRAASAKLLGSPSASALSTAVNREKLIERFLIRSQAGAAPMSGANAALTLLSR